MIDAGCSMLVKKDLTAEKIKKIKSVTNKHEKNFRQFLGLLTEDNRINKIILSTKVILA